MAPARSILLALALALAVSAPAAAKFAERPTPTPGDYWETKHNVEMGEGTSVVTTRTEIVGPEPITVEGVAYDAIKSSSKSSQTTSVAQAGVSFEMSTVTDATSWTRASDGATIRVVSKSTSTTPFGGPTVTESETIFTPPCLNYVFPIEVGSTWESECRSKTTVNGQTHEATTKQSFRVLREESVTVPAGTFDALVISNGTDESALTYWSPKACAPVRTTITTNAQTFHVDLQSYKCAKQGSFASGDAPPADEPANPTPPATDDETDDAPPTSPATSAGDATSDTPAPGALLAALALAGVALLATRRR